MIRLNQRYSIFLIIILCLCTAGCDAVYRILQRAGAEERDLIGEVTAFEPDEEVRRVQYRLKLFGYGIGTADGILGTNTRNAIAEFQEDHDLHVTRFIDNATWDKLMYFDRYGLIAENEVNPYAVQIALNAAGFDVGKVDGKLGPRSTKQLLAFQKAHDLEPDGRVGFRTLTALSGYLMPLEKSVP